MTPVSVSPLMTAQLIGAAPRYCGSSEACRLNFDELRCFQLFGLQYRKSQFERGQLNLALMQFLAPSGGFVGRCDHGHDVVAPGDLRPERRYGEFGRTHKYDAQLFRIHCSSYVMLRLLCVMRAF